MNRRKRNNQPGAGKKNSALVLKIVPSLSWKYLAALAVILLISFLAYLPAFQNDLLLTWDDDAYIRHNPLIYSFNLGEIFSENVVSNYHPFTILVLALEYHLFGLNPTGYHAVNLLLHLLNVILVFYTIYILSDKAVVALAASLLFGIHPMHVESVAWAAELKDLLYTFFFLASYIFYLKYLKNGQKKNYAFAILLFLVSLISKAMAASLPVVMILTDYFTGRKITKKTLLEKVPFFLLAIAFGIVAILVQQSGKATEVADYTFPQRIAFASYGFISYLYKLLLPINLSAFYPYPVKSGENIPLLYYSFPVLFAGLIVIVIYSLRFTKKIFFGFGFFAITIALVLQLFPVGSAIMADRYSYIPSIGIFYLAGEGFRFLWDIRSRRKWIILSAGVITLLLTIKTFERTKVWKDDLTLWNDVISNHQNSPLPFNNRGYYFLNEGKYKEAINDFNKAIEIDPMNDHAYNLRGMAFMHQQSNTEAISDFDKAIELDPGNAGAYVNRGWVLLSEKRNDEAINDFNEAIELDPDYAVAYNDRGIYFINHERIEEARNDFNKAIELDPGYAEAYYDRANVSMLEKKYEEAIRFYSRAIEAKNDYSQAYFYRGYAEYYAGKKEAACKDFRQASKLGYQSAADALAKFCK